MIPTHINEFIDDALKAGDLNVTVVYCVNGDTNMMKEVGKSQLTFNSEGRIKGSESMVTIHGYLQRLVKYSRKNIMIYLNNQALTDIVPKPIYQIEHIPELPHE